MAWTVTSRWINPSAWGGSAGTMRGRKARVVVMGVSSDATEMTDQIAIDISNLNTSRNDICTQIAIEKIHSSSSIASLAMQFDNTTDDQFLVVGSGEETHNFTDAPISASSSAGGTNDLVLTSIGAAAAARFTLDIQFRIK